jgi:hypothetical protein
MLMSQQLSLEVSDEIYADIQEKANAVGLSITEWIVAVLSKRSNTVSSIFVSLERQEDARQNFKNHAGSISIGHATGLDNHEIDSDLAKAYADEY